jgi:hypothetical protein
MSWAATCRDTWNARFDRLDAHLTRSTEKK